MRAYHHIDGDLNNNHPDNLRLINIRKGSIPASPIKGNKEQMAALRWYNKKVATQEAVIATLLAALRLCLPVMEVEAKASHLTDGFRPMRNKNDDILDRVKKAIEEAE